MAPLCIWKCSMFAISLRLQFFFFLLLLQAIQMNRVLCWHKCELKHGCELRFFFFGQSMYSYRMLLLPWFGMDIYTRMAINTPLSAVCKQTVHDGEHIQQRREGTSARMGSRNRWSKCVVCFWWGTWVLDLSLILSSLSPSKSFSTSDTIKEQHCQPIKCSQGVVVTTI